MQLDGGALADLRGQHHADKADDAADRQRHGQRLVAAAGLADRGAGDENQEDRKNATTVSLPNASSHAKRTVVIAASCR